MSKHYNSHEIQRLSVQVENFSWVENVDRRNVRQIDSDGITLDDLISETDSRHISADVTSASLLDLSQIPLSELLAQVLAISYATNSLAVLNIPAPFDKDETSARGFKAQLAGKIR